MKPSRCLALALLALPACERDDFYSEATFTDNVAAAYAECDAREITFLATKHGIQLAFDACGSNKFAYKRWSPDGQILSFHLTHGSHLLDAATMRIEAMPTETPIAGSAWVRDGLLAIPLPPSESAGAQGPVRIAWYDRQARTLDYTELPAGFAEPKDLQPAGKGDRLALSLVGPGGQRLPYAYDGNTGSLSRILDFIDHPIERFAIAPEADLVTWSSPNSTELLRLSTGESLHVFLDVTRGVPHREGRYLALEVIGEPISLFDQRTWNELSEDARAREQRRKEQWLETLPDWAPRDARPPEIHIVDLARDERYRISSFFGEDFEWYQPRNYWMSFILWGIEGKQLHRNVAVVDIAERLRMIDKGETPMGVERLTLAGLPIAGASPSAGQSVSPETPPAGYVSPGIDKDEGRTTRMQ